MVYLIELPIDTMEMVLKCFRMKIKLSLGNINQHQPITTLSINQAFIP
jgi:hypothetical protein